MHWGHETIVQKKSCLSIVCHSQSGRGQWNSSVSHSIPLSCELVWEVFRSHRLKLLNRSISLSSAVETSGLQVLAEWVSSESSAEDTVGFRKNNKGALFYLYYLDFYKGNFPELVVTLCLEKFWNDTLIHLLIKWNSETSTLPLLSAQLGVARTHCFLHTCNINTYRQRQSIVEIFFSKSESLESESGHWSQL